MALFTIPRRAIWFFAVMSLLVILFSAGDTRAQFAEAVVTVGDTTAFPNEINTVVSIFADNFPAADTIVGFNLWIQLDRPPDLMIFQTDSATAHDTTYWKCNAYSGPDCIDSSVVDPDSIIDSTSYDFITIETYEIEVGNFDTTGTLIAGWEYVDARSLSGIGTDLNIIGIADLPGGPVTKGFAPQQGGLLIKLLADILDVYDTLYWQCLQYSGPTCIDSINVDPDTTTYDFFTVDTLDDRIVLLQINKDFQDHLNLASTDPIWSIWTYEYFLDTNGWVCTQWAIDSTGDTIGCLSYERTSFPPWDSVEVVPDSNAVLDTSRIELYDGTLIVELGSPCGDINGDGDFANIIDLTFLIDYIFREGPAPNPLCSGDLNCDSNCSNIIDLTALIDLIFREGAPVCQGC